MSTTQKTSGKGKGKSATKNKQVVQEALPNITVPENQAPQTELEDPQIVTADGSAVILSGPLARKEIVEKIADVITDLDVGVTVHTEGGHIITEEQRQGERRQAERRQMEQEESDKANADEVARILASASAAAPQTATPEAPVSETAAPEVPETPETPEPAVDLEKQAEFLKQLEALQKQYGIQIPAANYIASTPRSGREQKNGISRPGSDTITGKVWRCADEITANKKAPASITELKQHPDLRQVNDHTIRTQYARWRQFNGVYGRQEAANKEPSGKKASAKAAVQWPAMADPDFFRYDQQLREGTLPEGYEDWVIHERNRRAWERMQKAEQEKVVATAQPSAPAQPQAIPAAMADEVYQRMAFMKENNTLPASLEEAYKAETARRNAAVQ